MKKNSRPPWDVYFSKIAEDVSERSTCIKEGRQFGAVIVNENREMVATGYNGNIKGAPHCEEVGCIKDEMNVESGMGHGICTAVHAEQNALIQAGKEAVRSTMYVNGLPCKICARLIVNAGIRRVVCSGDYSDKEGVSVLESVGVKVDLIDL